ncbi:hypothetical protein OC834_000900 [Tilletia horrida]|uniref:SnoaL-like domain-containing protein n=1 Tax=Tilletia horrida TaxID=155126 RepID=A0AAN6JPL9_9BASI|nr:hypothetical protein OC834_000900 [Tilletia horrida]KAK0539731.1 hypothetical protein OC835_000993 [Tilletia horrida]KAK0540605.1 hypothetical protein OC842_000377 [Tilletia horrida]KAK0557269.1 hypothetical protein OC844_005622 [Tilletia horrida]
MAAAAKTLTLEFLEVVCNQRNFSAASKYLTPDFISHHGAHKAEGLEAFVGGFQYALANFMPDFHMRILKSVADDESVWVWSEITGLKGGAKKESVDIFAVDKASGKLKEKWDVQSEAATQ